MSWVTTLVFHAALIAICAIVVISAPPRIVPEMGIDLQFQSSAGTASAGEQDAAPPAVRSVRPIGPNRPGAPEVSGNAPHGVETREEPLPAASAVEVPSAPPGDRQVEDAARDSSGIGWDGSARKLVYWRDPAFPDTLSAAGQEVECEARITVSAAGAVTRVEITRSSGYIEIDAGVEAALRDYLFSRINERKDTVGTIRFRFRLERQD
jgi:TonB family protein